MAKTKLVRRYASLMGSRFLSLARNLAKPEGRFLSLVVRVVCDGPAAAVDVQVVSKRGCDADSMRAASGISGSWPG